MEVFVIVIITILIIGIMALFWKILNSFDDLYQQIIFIERECEKIESSCEKIRKELNNYETT